MKFTDIQQFYRAHYRVSIPWVSLEETFKHYEESYGLDLDPDFQRGHVWTQDKRIAYVEYCLAGGPSAREIQFNSANWGGLYKIGIIQLVDGKQRLTSVQMFLNNEIPAYGVYYKDFEDKLSWLDHCFLFFINNLKTRKEVLEWYLQLNTGGVVHTEEEINRVKNLLEKEHEGVS